MTMKLFYINTILIILTACSKGWLDEKTSQNIAVPSTLKDFQALLDNAESGLLGSMNISSPALGQVASDESFITDASYASRTDNERNAYIWTKRLPYKQVSDWLRNYEKVEVCNIILEGLEKIQNTTSADQQNFNYIKGQALFQRARIFWELAQIFAPVYEKDKANNEKSIPLRIEPDINVPSKQSTVSETYRRIIDDLLEAKDLLPFNSKYISRASKIAAYAMLARVYLSMQFYDEAGKYSDSCLTYKNNLMDFNMLTSSASFPISQSNEEVIFYSSLQNLSTMGSQARIMTAFRNLYNINDLRNRVFFGTSSGLTTFKGNYSGSSLRFNGLAVDEQYLIRAECSARAGKTTEAMADLNALLKTRWDSSTIYIPVIAFDSADALRKILLERRKELLMRGLRWTDLRRLNLESRFAISITKIVDGEQYTLQPNSYKYTFPIPDDIIQIAGFIQNQGWD